MDTFQIWSLVFAGITSGGVVLGLLVSIFKFIDNKNKKVIAHYAISSIEKTDASVYIVAELDLINQTSLPTSIIGIDIVFRKNIVSGTHIEHIIQNLLTTVDTKNILLSPYESINLPATQFECPLQNFSEKAVLRIRTTQRVYKYPIFFREYEESLE